MGEINTCRRSARRHTGTKHWQKLQTSLTYEKLIENAKSTHLYNIDSVSENPALEHNMPSQHPW